MPKLSEIEIGPNDILIPDVSDEAIAALRAHAQLMGKSFSDSVLDVFARGLDSPRESLAGASVIVLDDEA
ncbi:hypothetical protein [Bosea sp. PAMC 26642]|uniref:hypothetical protein n=1 Tax=Bosea sp. (strain PAMC 26642) TaxID=1792307 RepID=UPI00076FF68A|nr:hypothetical protein [Bosea sp. PAMC 26642]AMJ63146.1 hypothetical protein AXW83_25100 [Bosea sp. PAMC 26642]